MFMLFCTPWRKARDKLLLLPNLMALRQLAKRRDTYISRVIVKTVALLHVILWILFFV